MTARITGLRKALILKCPTCDKRRVFRFPESEDASVADLRLDREPTSVPNLNFRQSFLLHYDRAHHRPPERNPFVEITELPDELIEKLEKKKWASEDVFNRLLT